MLDKIHVCISKIYQNKKYVKIPNNHFRLLASMVRSGISPAEGFRSLGQKKYQTLIDNFELGTKYSDVLKSTILGKNKQYIELIISAERSGAIPVVLEDIATIFENNSTRITQVIGILMYPIIVFIITFFLLVSVLFFVVPNIAPIISSSTSDLSIVTKVMIFLSVSLREYILVYFCLFVLGIITIIYAMKQRHVVSRVELCVLKVPYIGDLYMNLCCVNYILSLRTQIKYSNNISAILQSLADSTKSLNFKSAFSTVSLRIASGKRLSEALVGFETIPNLWSIYAKVGENSSNYMEMFDGLYLYYSQSVDSSLKLCMKILEPALMVGIGLVVGIVAFGILSPIYGLMNSFN